jgi:biotin carboxyl carrier protein
VHPHSVIADEHPPDPRGVRVTVVGMDQPPPPLVIEPAAVPVGPTPRSAGQGLLGGIAPEPPVGLQEGPEVGLTANGEPLTAIFDRIDTDRGVLRTPATEMQDADAQRVLLLDAEPGGNTPRGVVRREVIVAGWRVEVEIEPAARAALRERARRGREEAGRSGPSEVRAIIPGVVVSVSVAPGDQVAAGQVLLVVEAMKMQNELRAPREGSIERVAVGPGTTIEVGDLLLVIS